MRTLPLILGVSILAAAVLAGEPKPIVLENALFTYAISPTGVNLKFVDRATGRDFLRGPGPCALARVQGKDVAVSSAALDQGRLTLRFGTNGPQAVLKMESRPYCIVCSVESVSGDVDRLTFLNVPLTLQGRPDETFGACAHALNLTTRVEALPALQRDLQATCEKKFGLVAAKAALVAAPMGQMLPVLQQTLAGASELPVCRTAGPWARETPFDHGSYLFNFGSLTETNVTDWIDMVHQLGFTQIDNHGGSENFFRFGSMELNRKKWPDGWDSQQRIVARLHEAGIGSIFHTYAFFIDKRSKYVSPVPDRRLDAFRTFTLAEPLSADATEVTVKESTAGLTTVTGFFENNSVTLHVGDELITFGGVRQQAPWGFTGIKRGAFGTKAAAHDAGAAARHLKELFGLFVPDAESELFTEIAANHAEVVNRCGFDGIYLDAIDGSSILRGGDECWYWATKFVVEIQKRLKQPVGMEMSAMWHPFWQYRTRWQAWDFPRRGHVRFIDLHAASINGSLLLPLHLGWWGFWSFDSPQIEPTYPDVMETLGARLVGWDAGISVTAGIDRGTLSKTPLFGRAVDILRTCEGLRHANVFDERARASLRAPGTHFTLITNAAGATRFRQTAPEAHAVSLSEPWSLEWRVTNSFGPHPVRFRLEALMSAAPAGDTNAVPLPHVSLSGAQAWKVNTAKGVGFAPSWSTNEGQTWCVLSATNAGAVPQKGAWVRCEKRFEPLLNLKERKGLALEIEGDGSGALLAIRMECPRAIAYGAIADRYLDIDFTGRRTVHLVETESSRWSDYDWNDGGALYHVYRELVEFGSIESISVMLQNLPAGRESKVRLASVHAVPLRAGRLKNPRLSLSGQTIEFPTELTSGTWLECNGPDDCVAYGPKGEVLGKVKPTGTWPTLPAGGAGMRFSCAPNGELAPRGRVTVFCQGPDL